MAWAAADMADLTGQVAIVTGANSGIGESTALELARKGAHVVLACRSADKAQAAKERILAVVAEASVECLPLDLANLESVAEFASTFKAAHTRLDVLVNNAGIMAVPHARTAQGFESQFGVNHLGHFALTAQLFECLKSTRPSRVVTLSSLAHRRGAFDFGNLMPAPPQYQAMKAYEQSKLANLVFSYELHRRLTAKGLHHVTSVACHPGWTETNLFPHMWSGGLLPYLFPIVARVALQPAAAGCLPSLYAAVAPGVRGGEYYGPQNFSRWGPPVLEQSTPASHDEAAAKQLWNISEELTKIKFDVE
ncbi:short-chain dehydrogenase [Achlya hypogyna]|uniref:Short-chain dehydrogenase n=1 Tax=Achlya hypogyna TaxID=1202772 RepID=A0A1V9YEF0_ACHHY|nr:short-chain dehydrogenase [Achlya hypogyna]